MEGDLGLGWCRGGSINNWDLHAVVRFACGATAGQGTPSSLPTDDSFPWPSSPALLPIETLPTDPTVDDLCFQALLAEPNKAEAPQPSSLRNEAPTTQQPTPAADEAPAKPRPSGRGGGGPTRSNKRKTKKRQVHKEVMRVPAGSPSADLWAWRKYGQKPIKGSPYPRGYYRCSTDKNCKARKQVERCRADPATLIITYTGEHSHPVPLHRNSLAGTTRNKPQQLKSEEPQQARASDSAGGELSSLLPADTKPQQGSSSVGVEYEDKEEDETLSVRLLLEDTEMLTEDDALLFLKPDEPAPVVLPGRGISGCDCAMLLPKPEDDPAPAGGNGAGACDDVTLFPNKQPEEPGPVPVSSGGPDDVMLFPKPGEPQPMTVSANMTNGGARTASVINLGDEIKQFSASGLSAWEPAAAVSGWGL